MEDNCLGLRVLRGKFSSRQEEGDQQTVKASTMVPSSASSSSSRWCRSFSFATWGYQKKNTSPFFFFFFFSLVASFAVTSFLSQHSGGGETLFFTSVSAEHLDGLSSSTSPEEEELMHLAAVGEKGGAVGHPPHSFSSFHDSITFVIYGATGDLSKRKL